MGSAWPQQGLVFLLIVCLVTVPVGTTVTADPSGVGFEEGKRSQVAPQDPLSQADGEVGAKSSDPDPYMTTDAPNEVELGESFTISVTGYNRGDTAGEFSTLSISSPTLDTSEKPQEVTDISSTLSYHLLAEPGETIYTKGGDSKNADYALIEAGSSGGETWDAHASHELNVEVTPSETGTYVFYVRTTLTDPDDTTTKYTAPAHGDTRDQQGYEVQRITVEVTDDRTDDGDDTENTAPVIEDASPTGSVSAPPNEKRTFTVDAVDPDGDELEYTWQVIEDGQVTSEYREYDSRWFQFDDPGEYTIRVIVSDGADSDTHSWGYTVTSANEAPEIYDADPNSLETLELGDSVHLDVDTTDPDGDAVDYTWRIERDGTVVDTSEGSDDYNLDPDEPGEYTVTVSVSDGSLSSSYTWTASVSAPTNNPPEITDASPIGSVSAPPDEKRTFSINAVDPDGDDLEYTWQVIEDDEVASEYTQYNSRWFQFDDPGEYTIRVIVSDGTDSVSRSWEFNVTTANEKPVIDDADPNSLETLEHGDSVHLDVDTTDPDGDTVEYTWRIERDGELIDTSEGSDDYRFEADEPGEYTITVAVSDGSASSTYTWTAKVSEPANRAPEITDTSPSGEVRAQTGERQTFAVGVNDPDGDSLDYAWQVYTDGELLETHEGSPSQSLQYSSTGEYTVRAVIDDGASSVSHTWKFAVTDDADENTSDSDTEGEDNPETVSEQSGTVSGVVEVDGVPLPNLIVVLNGERTTTNRNGVYTFDDHSFETGEAQAKVIIPTLPRDWNPYYQNITINRGSNYELLEITPTSPRHRESEFLLGLACGDRCYRNGNHANSYYMTGWLSGGIAPPTAVIADVRDSASAGLAGDPVEFGLNAFGIVPIGGDATTVTRRLGKFAGDASPRAIRNMAEIISRSDRFSSVRIQALDALYDGAASRLKTQHGLSKETIAKLAKKRVNLGALTDELLETSQWFRRHIDGGSIATKGDLGEALTLRRAALRTDEVFQSVPSGTRAKVVNQAEQMTESNQYYLLHQVNFNYGHTGQEFDTLLVRTGDNPETRRIVGVIEAKAGRESPSQVRSDLDAAWQRAVDKAKEGDIEISHSLTSDAIPTNPSSVERVTAGPRTGFDVTLAESPSKMEELFEATKIVDDSAPRIQSPSIASLTGIPTRQSYVASLSPWNTQPHHSPQDANVTASQPPTPLSTHCFRTRNHKSSC